MDSFDYDSLDRYIRKFKRNIINKLETSNFAEKDIKNQSDLLCMVLDYSPKNYDEKKFIKKIEIRSDTIKLDDLIEKKYNDVPLKLNRKTSEESSSGSPERGSGPKLSKLSSKIRIGSGEFISRNSKDKIKENSVQLKIKNILFDIMDDVISINLSNKKAKCKLRLSYQINQIN